MAAVLSIRIAAILVFGAAGFGKYIEGFPPSHGEAPLGQNEVREEHFQQTALFARLPRVEQVIRPVREFEDLDRRVDVLGAGSGQPLDLVGGLRALGLPLGPLGVEEPVVDVPLQLVLVPEVLPAGARRDGGEG